MIENKGGLSFGVPVREVNTTLMVRSNPLFAAIITVNSIFAKLGIEIGGYPPVPKN